MIPQTGFEASGESRYTNRSEEEVFLRRIDAETAATLTIEGRSVLGAPIWCIAIGSGSTIMVAANVHPGEPCGRDAALMWFRDMAYSTDPDVVDYLQAHRVVLVPNVNIDGSSRPRSRDNANGVNLNRDYIALREPETRAVVRVVQREQPVLIMDMHQVGDDQGAAWRPYWDAPHDGHPDLRELGQEYAEDTADVLLEDDYTTLNYPSGSIPWGGLSTIAATWHAVGVLNEVAFLSNAAENVRVARITLDYLTEFHIENRQRLTDARQASLSRVIDGEVSLPAGQWHTSTTTIQLDPEQDYTITGEVAGDLLELHGITYDGQTVLAAQPGQLMAAYLLSEESSEYIANQDDWNPSPEGAPASTGTPAGGAAGWIRRDGVLYPASRVFAKHEGALRPVSQVLAKHEGALRPIGATSTS